MRLLLGGSIDIHKGDYYLTMGIATDHPSVSGLNAHGGINMWGNGISRCNGIGNTDGDLTISANTNITISPNGSTYIDNTLAGIVLRNASGEWQSLRAILDERYG